MDNGEKVLTNNQKLVIKWTKEHRVITALATDVMQAYKNGDLDNIKKKLSSLLELTTNHLMSEDVEFFQMISLSDSLDEDLVREVEEFITSFEETKEALMNFLIEHTEPGTIYNQEFFDAFNTIVSVLGKRISYEEENLYAKLYG